MPVPYRFVVFAGLSLLGAAGCGSSSGSPATVKPDTGAPGISFDSGVGISFLDAGVDATKPPPPPDATTPVPDAGMDVLAPPTDAELNTFPAFTPNAPQVLNLGGPVMSNPIFVPVIFAGDPYEAQIEAYLTAVGQSQYWAAAVGEYGVNAGTMATPIIMDETLPSSIDDTVMQTWLSNRLGTDPRFGALPDTSVFDAGAFDAGTIDASAPLSPAAKAANATAPANVIYVLFTPSGTDVVEQGGHSCQDFGGYHNSYYAPNGSNVVYAMLPRCGNFGELSGFDALSGATSHEIAEASTDPFVGGNGNQVAYGQIDTNHIIWEEVLGGGEVGDMCAQFPTAFYHPSEASMSPYVVQRIWSNKAAAAGHDPCQPALTTAEEPFYFNAVPAFGEVSVNFGQNFQTIGASAPGGVSTAIELDLFSDGTSNGEKWQVQALDANAFTTGGGADLIFSPASVQGLNGDKVLINVTNLANDGQSIHPFVLVSSLGDQQNWWIGLITN